MKKETKLWTQKDGTKIRICDMKDSHLINAIKMLERAAEKASDIEYPNFQGDMAQYYAESAWDSLQSDPCETLLSGTIYDNLCNEAIRRQILI